MGGAAAEGWLGGVGLSPLWAGAAWEGACLRSRWPYPPPRLLTKSPSNARTGSAARVAAHLRIWQQRGDQCRIGRGGLTAGTKQEKGGEEGGEEEEEEEEEAVAVHKLNSLTRWRVVRY